MNLKETVLLLNQLVADGVVKSYAIGGAVAATFYLEATSTMDVDVFIPLEATVDQPIISITPIFNYLKAKGCRMSGEHIVIGDWPVQFLPLANALIEEALRDAVTIDVDGIPARVFTAEHLAAIALQLGRSKDKIRLLQFLEQGAVEESRLSSILERHNLTDRWAKFKEQNLG